MITVLAGGTGSVKLVRGLVAQHDKVNVITNVGETIGYTDSTYVQILIQ